MRSMKSHQRGIVLLEAVAVLVVIVPLSIFGWNLACFYQMHHELRRAVDSAFKFGSAPDLQAVAFGSGATRQSLNLEAVFSDKVLTLKNNICTNLLFNKECSESITVQLLYAGRLYGLGTHSTAVTGVGEGITDDQIIVTVKIINQFQNLRTLTGRHFDTTILMRQAYQSRGGMAWIG